ncbi:MAG TPA: hypothetical protein VGG25_04160 [Streptosporangiaceae bacterium]
MRQEWFVGSGKDFTAVVIESSSEAAFENTYDTAPVAGPFSSRAAAQAAADKENKKLDGTKQYIKNHPAAVSTSDPSGGGSGSGSTQAGATFDYSGSGNSVEQTVTFGSPESGTQEQPVIGASQGCAGGTEAPDQDLVVPVNAQTSLTSTLAVDLTFDLGYVLVSGPRGGLGPQPLSPAAFVYETNGGQYSCTDEANDNGFEVSLYLSAGGQSNLDAWIVFPGAVSPDYPQGNQVDLGMTGAWAGLGISGGWHRVSVSGAAVCTGGSPVASGMDPLSSSAWLHIGGKTAGWEHCGRTVSGM